MTNTIASVLSTLTSTGFAMTCAGMAVMVRGNTRETGFALK